MPVSNADMYRLPASSFAKIFIALPSHLSSFCVYRPIGKTNLFQSMTLWIFFCTELGVHPCYRSRACPWCSRPSSPSLFLMSCLGLDGSVMSHCMSEDRLSARLRNVLSCKVGRMRCRAAIRLSLHEASPVMFGKVRPRV